MPFPSSAPSALSDHRPQLPFEIADPVGVARPRDLLVEAAGIADAKAVDAERAHLDRAELAVAHRDRLGRPEGLPDAEPGREEVDLALEGRLEELGPVPEVGEDRQVLGAEHVAPTLEPVGDLPVVDEDGRLGVADDQRRALLDLEVGGRKAPGEDVVALLGPLNDVDELLADEVRESHGASSRTRTVQGECQVPTPRRGRKSAERLRRRRSGRPPSGTDRQRCVTGSLLHADGRRAPPRRPPPLRPACRSRSAPAQRAACAGLVAGHTVPACSVDAATASPQDRRRRASRRS